MRFELFFPIFLFTLFAQFFDIKHISRISNRNDMFFIAKFGHISLDGRFQMPPVSRSGSDKLVRCFDANRHCIVSVDQ